MKAASNRLHLAA